MRRRPRRPSLDAGPAAVFVGGPATPLLDVVVRIVHESVVRNGYMMVVETKAHGKVVFMTEETFKLAQADLPEIAFTKI